MKYDERSFLLENQESIIKRETIVSTEAVLSRYSLEKELIAHVMAGNYRQAVQVMERLFDSSTECEDMLRRLPSKPDEQLRAIGLNLNSMLRVALLSSQIPVIYLHIIATHMGILIKEAPIEYLQEEQILHRIIEAYCFYAGEYNNMHYSEAVSQITDYIYLHIREELSLYRIADAVHFSATYVNRILKKETGYTTIQYIKRSRISLAKNMLRFHNLTVADIASFVGYPNSNYFCRVFHQLEGISPMQYREQIRERLPQPCQDA